MKEDKNECAVRLGNSEDLTDRGCFFYDNYEAYIADMAATGQNVYRLSLSWPRIIPNGVGEVNPKGSAAALPLS